MAVINIPGLVPTEEALQSAIPIGVSQLGTPVIDDVTIIAEFQGVTYQISLQSFSLTVNQSENIVETVTSGRNGTVKEAIQQGDYEISIQARVAELFDVFPISEIKKWKQIKDLRIPVTVINKTLDMYDIRECVIYNFSHSTIPGSINQANLSIELKSDEDFDLTNYEI
jgi:hypothetical protein